MADTMKTIAIVYPTDHQGSKPEVNFHRRRSIVREFALTTSTHGIPGIARSESMHNRIYWTICTLAFAGVMCYFVTESIADYFTYPTQTSISFSIQLKQAFPAVTFCNYSPIRRDVFMASFRNFTNSLNLTNTNDTNTITSDDLMHMFAFITYKLNLGQPVEQYFFPLKSMMISCVYNGDNCTENDFIRFASNMYGNCYTFNAKRKTSQSDLRTTTENGDSGKLVLQLYAHNQQYVPYLANDVTAAIVILIHDNTELPFVEVAGLPLGGGQRHKLLYKKRTHNLLATPYSDCTMEIPLAMQAMFHQYEGADYAYSQTLCFALCTQTYAYTECGCVHPGRWTARSVVLPNTRQIIEAPLCYLGNPCYANAVNRIINTQSLLNQYCSHCTQACESTDFMITPTAVTAPSTENLDRIKSFVENSNITLSETWSTTWQSEIMNNYLSVEVVTETGRLESYTDDASISSVDVLSNVGGHSGLWIGISFLSIMEIIEMIYRLILYHFYVFKRKLQIRNISQT